MADLANALMAYNEGFEAGDQVTFFYGQQTVDAVTGIPRARIYGYKVMLNPGDSTPLWEMVSALGFSSVSSSAGAGYVLGMDRAIVDGAAVWVHSRESGTSGLSVSTQFMYVDSSVLAGYQTSAAMEGAADSYGGINASAVYLNPRSGGRVGAVVVNPVTPSGSGASQSDGSGTSGNGSESGGSGGDNGGSGGGDDPEDVGDTN